MSSREAFLARVRQATQMGRAHRIHARSVPAEAGYIGAAGDLCQRFAAEVDAVGGQSYLVADMAAAREKLHLLLEEAGAKSAVCWRHELFDRLDLRAALAGPGVELLDFDRLNALPPDERRTKLLAADIGITSCDCAIAETGTLMMCSRPGQERVASLLPPLHVAIIERRQIVPDMLDVFAMFEKQKLADLGLPSNITFITGPSKTGDIELQLTTGVHGPGKWRVIVIQ